MFDGERIYPKNRQIPRFFQIKATRPDTAVVKERLVFIVTLRYCLSMVPPMTIGIALIRKRGADRVAVERLT